MDSKSFQRLLGRLLLVPVAALVVLSVLLGFALRQVTRSAQWVDHSDMVLADAYSLSHLMVDQETGLRGYLATGDRDFLQPFTQADARIPPAFDALLQQMSDNPEQTALVQKIRLNYDNWRKAQLPLLIAPHRNSMNATTLQQQKLGMDNLRVEWQSFTDRERDLRAQRNAWSTRLDRFTLVALVLLSLLALSLILGATTATFKRVSGLYASRVEGLEISQKELHAREQWLRTTLLSIGDAVIACDVEGRVEFMNKIAETLTGWSEVLARGVHLTHVFNIINESSRATVESPVDKVRRLGTIVGLANHTVLIRKDGSEVCIDDSGAPIRDVQGDMIGIVLVFRDITEKKSSDQALLRAEKLASAGRLSASIAHEVNNPLEALMNLIYLARVTEGPEDVRRLLLQAEGEVGRISHLTRQTLGFYKDSTTVSDYDLSEVVLQVVDFYQSRASMHGIELESRIVRNLMCHGSSGEVQQVLSNLLANSLDACRAGSRVIVSLRRTGGANGRSDECARITVADTGCGIEKERLPLIFDAFHTSKETTGTGLGLWVTKQLVEKHGGRIAVRSRAGDLFSGTVVQIVLPRVSEVA